MEAKPISVLISDSIGAVSAIIRQPKKMKAMIVLAHGAGAGMHHSFMEALAEHLEALHIGTMRFNFPFTENAKRRPDPPAVAEKTVARLLQEANKRFPATPIFAAGKSFGGRMSSQYMSKESPDFVKGIVFYGFPLHPPGQKEKGLVRSAHLGDVRVPMLFLQGTRDALADLSLMQQVCDELPLATLVTFEGADHSFKSGKKVFVPELSAETEKWMDTHT